MNRLFLPIVLINLVLASCAAPQPVIIATPTIAITEMPLDPLQTPWDDREIFRPGLMPSAQSALDGLSGASVYHIEVTIEDDLQHVTGRVDVRYANTESTALDEVRFHLYPNVLGGEMRVSKVQVNEEVVEVQTDGENSYLRVLLNSAIEPGQSVVISMNYAVTIPQSLEQNYGVLAYASDVLALAHAYPMVAVYDEDGWHTELPAPQGDVTFADASFYIVRITASLKLQLVTTGFEVNRIEKDQTQELVVASGPARDFYLAASEKYQKSSQTAGPVTIHTYAPKELETGAQVTLNVAARAIEDFSQRYAEFPYTEFDIVSTPTLALGIEYPGLIAVTDRIYDMDTTIGGTPASVYMEATVAHEVGHQWFYNLVGDDQLNDPWLDESLTQFATLQYFSDLYGSEGASGFRQSLEGRWERVNQEKIPIGLPVENYSGSEYSAIIYGRGPLFFEALKAKMGAETFDTFMKEYVRDFSWGISTPEGFQSLAEQSCGCELDEIFDDWVYP